MKESDVLSFLKEIKHTLPIFTNPSIDTEKVVTFSTKVLKKGAFIAQDPLLNAEEFVAAITLVALLSLEKGKLNLCGDAYEALIYFCLKVNSHAEVSQFLLTHIDSLPIEVFEGVLRGIAIYDQETKTDIGKSLLQSALRGRTIAEIEERALLRTFNYRVRFIWNKIKYPLLGGIVGWIIGQLSFSIFFTK